MFSKILSSEKNSKWFMLTAVFVSVFACFSTASAQMTSNKPRPAARLITTVSSDDLNNIKSSSSNTKTNHPKNVNSASAEKEPAANKTSKSAEAVISFVSNAEEKKTLELINKERQKYGFAPLVFDPELCRLARAYSERMAKYDFFSHINPEGKDVQGRAREFGITKWKAIGENLAFNQGYDDPVGFAVEHWMKSSSHRSNILLAMWTATGIGVAKGADDSYYITQVFMVR